MVTTRAETNLRLVAPVAFPQQAAAQRIIKRTCDLTLALPALLVLSPFFGLIALWIKLNSTGPVFFRQVRSGRRGQPFRIFKFRTMVADADQRGTQLTVGEDRRITHCGQFLRRYKFDELPQLINVLLGEMTLVGPRPEVPHYVAQYSEQERAILLLTPGITSPASLAFKSESELLAQQSDPEQFYLTEVMPAKIRADLAYAQRANWLTDFGVMAQTVRDILS
ncbi:MAG: sugar transferase [Acidobacteria bacterium]|nr:sugar transferase [Acidobacteriota bacterium]MBI3421621.1 sugar transferase [Acidobacteriota bacterium]